MTRSRSSIHLHRLTRRVAHSLHVVGLVALLITLTGGTGWLHRAVEHGDGRAHAHVDGHGHGHGHGHTHGHEHAHEHGSDHVHSHDAPCSDAPCDDDAASCETCQLLLTLVTPLPLPPAPVVRSTHPPLLTVSVSSAPMSAVTRRPGARAPPRS